MSGYEPSAQAVEAVARELTEMQGPHPLQTQKAKRLLVAFMGATVTEPCANPECDHGTVWLYEGHGDPCPGCPAPRSLPVVECERAGVLVLEPRRHPAQTVRQFREVVRSTPKPSSSPPRQ